MLKSRRGLLAAGLAVAVVGTIGVASTINAGADEIAGAPEAPPAATAAASTEAAAETTEAAAEEGTAPQEEQEDAAAEAQTTPVLDAAAVPPSLLPWGERPRKAKRGKPGISAKALRATDADVAPADASGSVVPKARSGPKGRTSRNSYLRSEVTQIAPPQPAPAPTASGKPDESNRVKYLYNVARQDAEFEGAYATLWIAKPRLEKHDYHTLAELAVQSADATQIVEIGWTVDRLVNGDDDPHLFVYHWVDNKTSCYNGCGFVQVSKNIKPGDTLAYDTAKKFGIQNFNGSWWVAYDSEWIGYFPEEIWNKE
ncbi:MAG: neprosin family prolyl endopeptidase, partial [Actinoplanes sp.]